MKNKELKDFEQRILDYISCMWSVNIDIEDFVLWINPFTNKELTGCISPKCPRMAKTIDLIEIYESDFGTFSVKTCSKIGTYDFIFLPKGFEPKIVEVPVVIKKELKWGWVE